MVTVAIDNVLSNAVQISDIMREIDTEGMHFATKDLTEVLRLSEEYRPNVAFLDIEMPEMNGLEIAQKISEASPETNIVFVTEHPEYAIDAFALYASGYILKPATEEKLRNEISHLRVPPQNQDDKLLRIQCFGNFEVFGPEGIVRFSRSLGKEALAYLIDRRGAGCTVGEICSVLWEDRQVDKKLKSQRRVIMASLKKDLTEAGAGDVIVKEWNTWSIDPDKINCDYYAFLKNDREAVNSFGGEYMKQYSWAEMTVGNLIDIQKQGAPVS